MSYLLGLGTDEAYVESLRRLLATPKAYRRRCFRTVLILAAMFLLLYVLVPAGFAWLSGSKRDPLPMSVLLRFQNDGYALASAVMCLLMGRHFWRGLRCDRLMIRFHDELQAKQQLVPETEGAASKEREDPAEDSLRPWSNRWFRRFRRDYAWKARTDEECVALARLFTRRMRWAGVICFGCAALLIGTLLIRAFRVNGGALLDFGMIAWAGLVAGLVSGWLLGIVSWCVIDQFFAVMMSFRHPRVGSLMLRFHDAVGALTCEVQQGRL